MKYKNKILTFLAILLFSITVFFSINSISRIENEKNNELEEVTNLSITKEISDSIRVTFDEVEKSLIIMGKGTIDRTFFEAIDLSFEKINNQNISYLIETLIIKPGFDFIKSNSISYFHKLKNLIIEDCSNIEVAALSGCGKLQKLSIPNTSGNMLLTYPLGHLFGSIPYEGGIEVTQLYMDSKNQKIMGSYYIPSSLEYVRVLSGYINNGAFYNCNMIKEIELPYINTSGTLTYGKDAFYGCTGLTNIYYNGKVDNSGWLNIEFENEFSNPMSYASSFYVKNEDGNYYELLELEIKNNISKINDYAFYSFDNLLRLNILSSQVQIGKKSFYNCSDLVVENWIDSDITIVPADVSIDELAFYGCDNLGMLYIEESNAVVAENIGQPYYKVLSKGTCGEQAKYIFCEGGLLYIYGYGSVTNSTTVESGNNNSETKYFFDYDFDVKDVTSLIIGDNIEVLPENAFRGFNNLHRIFIGESVRKIGNGAFYECPNVISCYFLCDFTVGLNYNYFSSGLSNDKFVIYHSSSANGWENIKSYNPLVFDEVWSSGNDGYMVCLPEEKTILAYVTGTSYYLDSQGIKYELNSETGIADVIGYSSNNASITTITIPCKVYFNNKEYNVKEIKSNAFSTIDCYTLSSISILVSNVEINENAFSGCINLDVIYFEAEFPEVTSVEQVSKWARIPNNTAVYFVTLDEISDDVINICKQAGVSGVYLANRLEENRVDENGIKYTMDSKTMQAIVGEKTKVDETTINTSGSSGVMVEIPDFVAYNNRIYIVVGFDRYAFYQSDVEYVSFGKFIGYYETNDNPAIWDNTFREMENLKGIIVNPDNEIYFSENGILYSYGLDFELSDPITEEEYIRSPLRLVKAPAKFNNPNNVVVKQSTTIIERYAFSGSNVEKIDLAGVQIIGSNAFNNCINLRYMDNTYGIYYIESYAFANTKVTGLDFLAVSYIGDGAFLNANLSGEIQLSKGVVYIGDGAFRDNNVERFTIKDSSIYYTDDYGVLYNIQGENYILLQYPTASKNQNYLMKDFDLNIIEIKPYAFSNAEYLEKVTLSDATKVVGSFAFEECTSLEEVYIGSSYFGSDPSNIESGLYSYGLFNGDFNLKKIIVSDENENFTNDSTGVLYSKDFNVLYCYPAGLERSSYTLKVDTVEIYSMAFYYNHHIRRVIISNLNFSSIGDMAFSSCDELEEIYFGCEIPLEIGNKIFDNTTLSVRYKEGFDSWSVYEDILWNGAEVSSYEVISELSNDKVSAEDYLFVVVGTDGKPIEGAEFGIYIGDNDKPIIGYTDEEGLVFFSKANFEKTQTVIIYDKDGNLKETEVTTIHNISIDIYKEEYFSYKQDMYLDFENNITYITLTKLPSIFGVSCDNNDINSQEFILNTSEYGKKTAINQDYVDNEMLNDIANGVSNDEIVKKSQMSVDETISVVTVIYYDGDAPQNIILHQNGNRVNYKDSDVSVVHSISNKSLTYTFTINPKDLLPDTPLEVGVLDDGGEILVSQVLNVSIIGLTVNSDDINLEFPEQDVDMGQAGSATNNDLLSKLIGIDNMNIKVSKNVQFTTKIEGNRVTLTLKGDHKGSKTISNEEDFEAKYKENVNKYGKNTYYFTYDLKLHEKEAGKDPEKNSYHIVIRFGLDTIDDGYSYYRLNVYDKPNGKVLHTLYGRVNADSNLRYKFGIKSTLIFTQFWSSVQEQYQKYKKADENKQEAMAFSVKKNATAYIEPYKKPGYSEHETKHSFSASLSGSVTFEWVKGEGIKFIEGAIIGSLNYKLEHSSQFIVVNVPVVLEIELSVGGTLTFKFKFDKETIIDPTELSLKLELEISASVGVGCSLASVGVYGKIGTIFIFDIIPEAQIRMWEIHGEVGLYFKVLWFRYDLELFSGQYYIIPDKGKPQKMLMFNSMSNMYLAQNYKVDETNDYEEMSYMFIYENELFKIHFVDMSNSSNYDQFNNRKLAISKWNEDGLWEEPRIIDDNGLNDGSYFMYVEDGNYYLSYTQQTRKLDSTTVNDTYASASNLEFKVVDLKSYFTNEEISPISVQKGSYYKYLETIQIVDGTLTVAWVENSDNNIFGVSPKNYVDENGVSYSYATFANSIYVSQLIGDKWITSCIKTGLSTITDLAITSDGVVSYIVDTNSDLATTEDRCLNYIELSNVNLEKVLQDNGIISLEQYNGEILYYYETMVDEIIESGFKYIDLNNPNAEEIVLPKDIKISNTFAIVKKENNIFGIIYSLNETWMDNGEECVGSALYGIFYDGQWGNPIKLLEANNEEYITNFSAVVHENELIISLSYSNKDGNILRNEMKEFTIDSNIVLADLEYNYEEKTITVKYINKGLQADNLYYLISGQNGKMIEKVLPGKEGTFVITFDSNSNLYDLLIFSDTNQNIYNSEISFEYADLSISTKQVIIGEDDVLLVSIKNNGNYDTNATVYVNTGYLSANQIINSQYVMRREIELIEGGKTAYLNVILDPYLLSTGRITIYVLGNEFEKDYLSENNLVLTKLNTIVNIENTSSLSSNYAKFDEENNIKVNYVASTGYKLKEIKLISNTRSITSEGITYNQNEITFSKDYLFGLTSGINTFEITFEGEYGKKQILYFDVEIPTKYTVIFDTYNNGVFVQTYILEEGVIPQFDGIVPSKLETQTERYEFIGWDSNGDEKIDSLVPVYKDTKYVAVFKPIAKEFVVTWEVETGNYTKESYVYGSIPSYKGTINSYIVNGIKYEFIGWDSNDDGKVDQLTEVYGDCSYKAIFIGSKHVHSMQFHPANPATTINDGNEAYYTCDDECCKNIYFADKDGTVTLSNVIIPKLPSQHNYVLVEIIKSATCTEDGEKVVKCLICGEIKNEVIVPTGHNYQEIITESNLASKATCQSKAQYYKICSCGHISESTFEYGKLSSHDYSVYETINEGKHYVYCANCDGKLEQEHTWSEGQEVVEGNVKVTIYTCVYCNYSKIDTNMDHIHSYESYEHFNDRMHSVGCDCGHTLYEEHKFDEGVETIINDLKYIVYTCQTCNFKLNKNIGIPEIIEGKNQVYNGKNQLTITSSAYIEDFIEIRINGEVLDENYYIIAENSTTITLSKEYLNSLEEGIYKLEIVSVNGVAVTNFSVKNLPSDTIIIAVIASASVIVVAFAIIIVVRRKNRIIDYIDD